MLRTAGPPIDRAGACRKARSRSANILAKVTLAPSVIRELAISMRDSAGSVARTTVEIEMSPSLRARMTSVPPPR
jgi:hypothetical protein